MQARKRIAISIALFGGAFVSISVLYREPAHVRPRAEDAGTLEVAVDAAPEDHTAAPARVEPVASVAATTARGGAASERPLRHEGPRRAVDAQIAALAAGDEAAFVAGFVPELVPDVTHAAFLACRDWIVGRVVRPDWDVAEERTIGGHRVTRVSMFGKSMTGFVETAPGEWKADRVWCMPPMP